jgi:hypothetical protein
MNILQLIEDRFNEDVLADEHLSQVVLDWEEYREYSGYSADSLVVFVLKDMVIEMKRLLDIRNAQVKCIGCS